jgi:NAD(P)H dehydrogenase (quinone)
MVKFHIVHAHPEPQSFNTAMANVARKQLESSGNEVTFSDLYAMNFDPVVRATDFRVRANNNYLVYAKEQRHSLEREMLAPDIMAEVDALMTSDTLVLVFPLYWYSVPALIKGWLDRCFVSGLMYGGKRIYAKGGMLGKRAVVGVSLGGREHMFGPQAIHGDLIDGMLRHLLQGTLGYVGFEVVQPFVAWHIPYCSAEQRAETMSRWRQFLTHLDDQPRIKMPNLDLYDEIFRPIA